MYQKKRHIVIEVLLLHLIGYKQFISKFQNNNNILYQHFQILDTE